MSQAPYQQIIYSVYTIWSLLKVGNFVRKQFVQHSERNTSVSFVFIVWIVYRFNDSQRY
jgi:hypothetical protein